MLQHIYSVFYKDILSEYRTRYAISTIVLFVLVTITIIAFNTVNQKLSPQVYSALIWVVMFFSTMTGIGKSFISEEERGTSLLLKLLTNSDAVYFGKLLYNVCISILLSFFAIFLYQIFDTNLKVAEPLYFYSSIMLGALGFAGATTIISAIIAKANSKNALFPVLSFPILLPLILIGVDTTAVSISGTKMQTIDGDLIFMAAYFGVMVSASFLLFEIVWKD